MPDDFLDFLLLLGLRLQKTHPKLRLITNVEPEHEELVRDEGDEETVDC
ncbi:hypothetical protein NIES2100_44610 [Calothrix sp. NIES-2100]|nr:hypothetical protein NIES2100_44610 [Calothrix sp. NIES-2100]